MSQCTSYLLLQFLLVLPLLAMHATPAEARVQFLSAQEERELLSSHNHLRSLVNPPAADMQRMEWDVELAAVAQHYSEQCVFEHNPHRSAQAEWFPYVGENIAITNNPVANYTALVGGWYSEIQYYDTTTNQCVGKECRHYTQVVWASTSRVGCGACRCAETVGFPHPFSLILVCNYGPGGNLAGETPYLIGVVPCSLCPQDKPHCWNNLCIGEQQAPLKDDCQPE